MLLRYNDEIIVNSVSDETVIILDSDSLNLYEINACGMAIFVLFNGNNTYSEALDLIKKKCSKLQVAFYEQYFQKYVDVLLEYGFLKKIDSALINDCTNNAEIDREWSIRTFNPEVKMVSDMSEGFFSKVHVE